MRKDVKFGLTIAAILVAVLAVYVIVLTRSGEPAAYTDQARPSGEPAGATDANNPTPDNTQTPSHSDASDSGGADRSNNGANNQSSPVADGAPAAPATQPAIAAANPPSDWNQILNNGGPRLFAADSVDHTVTPTLDPSDGKPLHRPAVVGADARPALIDAPTTQPAANAPLAIAPSLNAPIADAAPTANTLGVTVHSHVVAPGESLWTISQAIYGDGRYYLKIIDANPKVDPKHLKVGTTLIIPPPPDGVRTSSASDDSDNTSRSVQIDPATQYRVKSGDSLELIARRLYGDPAFQTKIYDLNQALIGPDENRLKVGWVLKLPQPPTKQQ